MITTKRQRVAQIKALAEKSKAIKYLVDTLKTFSKSDIDFLYELFSDDSYMAKDIIGAIREARL